VTNLDVNTLFLVSIYVEAILGLLLLFAWVQNTSIKAVAWWGFAHLLRAAAYTWATAWEFWRGRSESLVSRWPAIFTLFAHGALYLLRTPFGAMLPWSPTGNQVFESVWMTVLSFEALLFTIAIAFILLAMAKERTEYRHKTAALIDPLTGIANRRAFLQDGEAQLKRQAIDPRPTAVMLLDLDNFKSINDRFGHAIGDRVLEIFAEEASGCMRRMDFFGRLGGEEFAALLLDTTRERAMAVGEDIRARFAAATRDVEGRPVAATVSVGVVISHDAVLDLSALLAQADHALYRAKDSSRNRVEIASIELILDRAKRGAADLLAAGSPAATPAAKTAA